MNNIKFLFLAILLLSLYNPAYGQEFTARSKSGSFSSVGRVLPLSDVDQNIRQSSTRNPDGIAIILGVEKYKSIPGVPYAQRDAETFRQYAEKVLGVPNDKIYAKTNENVSKGELEKLFTGTSWLSRRVKPESDVYIFYAGHGAPDISEKKAYLIPYDGDANYASQTGFSLERLYNELKKLNARSITVFLDACFSGGTRDNQNLLADARSLIIKIDNPVLLSNKLTVFAASNGEQISSGYPDKNHGLFSYYLLKGMRGDADANRDGAITSGELGSYLDSNVSRTAAQLDREQSPQLMTVDKNRVLVRYR